MAIEYTNSSAKYTQIGIFGMKILLPSGNPE
jgi:hypothetical protein